MTEQNIPTPNTELFKKVYDQISTNPQTFYMKEWETTIAQMDIDGGMAYWDAVDGEWFQFTECGTTRCVAGWGLHFTAPDVSIATTAVTLVDVDGHCGSSIPYFEAGAKVFGIDASVAKALFTALDETAFRVVEAFAEGRNDDALAILYAKVGR